MHFCAPVVAAMEREVGVMKIHRLVARRVTEEEWKLESSAILVSVAANMVVVIVHCGVSVVALSVGVLEATAMVVGCEHGELVVGAVL